MEPRYLIVGLGNPGDAYRDTRHNLGFEVVDLLGQRHGVALTSRKFKARYGSGEVEGCKVLMSKPQTYMNRSGQSVGVMAGWHRIPPKNVIVIHDDLDLALGRVKLKTGGGHGGHNGLRDIAAALGDSGFQRVRMGIDRPASDRDSTDHVLSRFRPDERPSVGPMVDRAADAVQSILAQGIEASMNEYNTRGGSR